MHVPGSLASPSRRGLFVARRRRRTWPGLLLGAAVVLALWLMLSGQPLAAFSGDDPGAADSSTPEPTDEPAAAGEPDPAGERPEPATPAFASHGPVELHLPTSDPVVVGFHEASSGGAIELDPIGSVVENENTTKFEPPDADSDGPEYLVLSSRGRVQAATSAVDVVMRDGDPVLSPVHGTVTDVRTYHLYGSHKDHRIEVAPDASPGLRVVLIHVADVEVDVGDDVVAGRTRLAGTARPFAFSSQIDRYTEPERWPHVHLEVKHEDDAVDDVEQLENDDRDEAP